MSRFVSKVVEIEAVRLHGENHIEVEQFVRNHGGNSSVIGDYFRSSTSFAPAEWRLRCEHHGWGSDVVAAVYDKLHNTWVGVKDGQWIILGMKGEFYPCDHDVFEAKYDPILGDAAPEDVIVKAAHE